MPGHRVCTYIHTRPRITRLTEAPTVGYFTSIFSTVTLQSRMGALNTTPFPDARMKKTKNSNKIEPRLKHSFTTRLWTSSDESMKKTAAPQHNSSRPLKKRFFANQCHYEYFKRYYGNRNRSARRALPSKVKVSYQDVVSA